MKCHTSTKFCPEDALLCRYIVCVQYENPKEHLSQAMQTTSTVVSVTSVLRYSPTRITNIHRDHTVYQHADTYQAQTS